MSISDTNLEVMLENLEKETKNQMFIGLNLNGNYDGGGGGGCLLMTLSFFLYIIIIIRNKKK